jgi:hypothetical protein
MHREFALERLEKKMPALAIGHVTCRGQQPSPKPAASPYRYGVPVPQQQSAYPFCA